jgi:DNA-binding transcriptional MerR regulator
MSDTYSTPQVADLFQVSPSTIRNWCEEFAPYLSPHAAQPSRARSFSEDDLEVLALIAEQKALGKNYADIHGSLSNGERAQPPNPSALSSLPSPVLDKLQTLTQQVHSLTTENAALRQSSEALRIQVAQLETEIRFLREQASKDRELGRLEGELTALKKQLSPKD